MAKSVYVSVIDYKYEFDRYFNDHYVLKYNLFDIYVHFVQGLLKTEPMPHRVINGDNDMMFCGNWHHQYVNASKGFLAYESNTVASVSNTIEEQSNWCAQHAIAYYFAVAPNKLTVYGENLPIEHFGNPPLRELVKDKLPPTINFIDYTATLLNHKAERQLYHNDDTHWNQVGAYFAYVQLMEAIQNQFPDVQIIASEEYTLDSIVGIQNDLVRQIRQHTPEYQYILQRNSAANCVELGKIYKPEEHNVFGALADGYEERYSNKSRPLKIMVLRDSFGVSMVEYIRESFGESVFIWSNTFDTTMIVNEKPDILVNMIVERHLESQFSSH
ncbi:MAG: hypothetical protein K9G46_01940 [Flavobacteriales bacterium]|nr:hypothetical protein [Flavobacteriales bacterium]